MQLIANQYTGNGAEVQVLYSPPVLEGSARLAGNRC